MPVCQFGPRWEVGCFRQEAVMTTIDRFDWGINQDAHIHTHIVCVLLDDKSPSYLMISFLVT